MINLENSVGIVEKKFFTINDKIKLESGVEFGPVTVAYETYGKLNEKKNNVLVVFHALSGDSHAAGLYSEEDSKPGWWEDMIGPARLLIPINILLSVQIF